MEFMDCLDNIEDVRKDINKSYQLTDMIFLTMAAVLSGAKGWKGIKLFGEAKLDWLRQYRPFENGIPTRQSIGRIIRKISAQVLMDSFIIWINQQREESGIEHIAFDGKTLKGSGKNNHVNALHLMSAMVVDSGITLYQQECDEKSNEIGVMQSMLDVLEVEGSVLSADAMHCQKKTLSKTQEKGADIVLQVKDNQKNLKEEIQAWFHKCRREGNIPVQEISDIDGEHGRIVERSYRMLPADNWLSELEKWPGIKSVIEVCRTHYHEGSETQKVSYHMSTLDDLSVISDVIRRHWQIESHHWILDTALKEDDSHIYSEDGAKNMALLRRMLLNIVKSHPLKDSVAGKFQRAAWDDDFRGELLFGQKTCKV